MSAKISASSKARCNCGTSRCSLSASSSTLAQIFATGGAGLARGKSQRIRKHRLDLAHRLLAQLRGESPAPAGATGSSDASFLSGAMK